MLAREGALYVTARCGFDMEALAMNDKAANRVGTPQPLFTQGDVDGFFGLAIDNLIQFLLILGLCTHVLGFPLALLLETILPGAALSIVIGNQAIAFKGAPGEAIVYPSTTLHEVVPVRSGERLVAITFIESYIPDPHQRMQVYELNEIAALEGTTMRWENRVRLDVVRHNLMRMWSTT